MSCRPSDSLINYAIYLHYGRSGLMPGTYRELGMLRIRDNGKDQGFWGMFLHFAQDVFEHFLLEQRMKFLIQAA